MERIRPREDSRYPRVDEADPRALGIHSAVPLSDSDDGLAAYVERDFDFKLRAALTLNARGRGSFVIMVGGSSTGKTRSLYEAVYGLVPDWWLVHPAAAADLIDLKNEPPRGTVFWLDELQRYLGGHPALTSECVWALVQHGNFVVGTLWPDQYAKWTAGTEDVHRLVANAAMISVPEELNTEERAKAEVAARHDSRIQNALEAPGIGFTQVLAGGPRLVMCWEQPANHYAKAMITAAADAHRLGVQSPLSEEVLTDAMYGYLPPRRRLQPVQHWLAEALPHTVEPFIAGGDVSPLVPADDGRPGVLAGYTIADYLAQYIQQKRRFEPVPHRAWKALVTKLSRVEDLRRVADSALARLRYCYAEPALNRLTAEFRDGRAAAQLADLLIRQDRLDDALDVLQNRSLDHRHELVRKKLMQAQQLWERVAEIRPPSDPRARGIPGVVAELLADGGVSDGLRRDADADNARAAERLVEHLSERGCVRELRDRADGGDVRAKEALADLYAAWGEVDRLRERAESGDRAAALRLPRTHRGEARRDVPDQIIRLRADVDGGRPTAAFELCTLLFELRDEENLRAELDAGTSGAAERLIALYTAQEHESLIPLRAYGLDADGELVTPETNPMDER